MAQVRALKVAWLKGRNAVAGMRASKIEGLHALVQAALAEPVDRAELDETARRFADDQGQAARDLVEALDAALTVLTPEQKEKLRARFGRFGTSFGTGRGPFGPDNGPYRSGPGFI
jgi:Spy/CpxP family protein refolding chaperone